MFQRTGTAWAQQTKLIASVAAAGDGFGEEVTISGDTVAVGSEYADDGSGAAYVFQRTGTTWKEQAKLTASDATEGDEFGESVAISGDTIVVGADDAAGAELGTGAAYVFQRIGTTWTQQTKLTAEDGAEGDEFGFSISIRGATIVVGAYGDDHGDGRYAGSIYLFAAAPDR